MPSRPGHSQVGSQGLGVVLTGTDLYRDLAQSVKPRRSVAVGRSSGVLQSHGAASPATADMRHKAVVIYQSTPTRQTLPKTTRHLRAVMVGHLRDEKDPLTLMAAAALLPGG